MFKLAALCMAFVGHLSIAVPLQGPSANLAQYFDSRIVGGSDATPGSAPHTVALVVGQYYVSFVCGGSVITSRHVLSAAHCIFVDWWTGELLETFFAILGTDHWNHGGITAEFESHAIHPQYNGFTIKNDCGVLKLKKPLKLGLTIAIIALAAVKGDGGQRCCVSGWGTKELWGAPADKLQILCVDTISAKECQRSLLEVGSGAGTPSMDPKVEICTFHSAGHGMCHGDSGSAVKLLETGEQVGLVSWGVPCAVGGPDVHTSVPAMLPFITSVLKGLPFPTPPHSPHNLLD